MQILLIAAQIIAASLPDSSTYLNLEASVTNAKRSPVEAVSAQAPSLDKSLLENPSVTLVQRGPFAAEPVLRGNSGGDILVTIDGARVQSACTDRMDPVSSYVSSENVKAIRVSAGANGLAEGAPPLGHVNFELKHPQPDSSKFHWTTGADYSTINQGRAGFAGVKLQTPRVAVSASVSEKAAENYSMPGGVEVKYSSYHTKNAMLASTVKLTDALQVRGTFLYDRFWDVGYPALPMDVGSSELKHGSVALEAQSWDLNLYANATTHVMDDTKREYLAMNMHMDMPGWGQTQGAYGNLHKTFGSHQLRWRFETWRSWQKADMTMYYPNASNMYLLTWPNSRTLGAQSSITDAFPIAGHFSGHSTVSWESRSIDVQSEQGIRQLEMLDSNLQKLRNFRLPGILFGSRFVPDSTVSTGVVFSVAQRAPSMDELYGYYLYTASDNREHIGNSHLTPMTIYQAEWNGELRKQDRYSLRTTIWVMFKDQAIEAIDDPSTPPMTPGAYGVRKWGNRGKERRFGVETDLRWTPFYWLEAGSVARYSIGKAYQTCHIAQVPTTGGAFHIAFRSRILQVMPEWEWAPEQNRLDPAFTVNKSPAYIVTHLRLSGRIPVSQLDMNWRAGIENVLDQKWRTNQDWDIFDRILTPMYRPGRSCYIGFTLAK